MNALHPLGQLIQSVEDSTGWTIREIARRAGARGLDVSHQYVGRLKRNPIRSVTYETIQALSVGLGQPERIVAIAALESMGVHDIGSAESGAAVAIARDPDLSERDRRILLAVVREMQGEHLEKSTSAAQTVGGSLASLPEPDGVTSAAAARAPDTSQGTPEAGTYSYPLHRGDENADSGTKRPWEQGDFDMAAKRGRNRGREARQKQDREAEDGGA